MTTSLHLVSINQDPGIDPKRKKGAAVHLAAMRTAFRQLGLKVTVIDESDPAQLQTALEQIAEQKGADLIYERYAHGRSLAARFALRHGIPYVVEVNAPLADEQALWRGKSESEGDRAEDAVTFAAAGFVAAVSTQVAAYAMARGAEPGSVFICPNGVDTRFFRPRSREKQMPSVQIPESVFVLGFHGRERPWHGFEMLVDATLALLGKDLPVHLLVIGEGNFSALARLPSRHFTRLPWVEYEEIPALIARFDALPLTYRPETPFYFSPLKLAEAMACGAVPVVPDLGDLSRIVEHGRSGLVYPPGDLNALIGALLTLATEPSRKSSLSAAAADSAREWGWDRIAHQVLDHFGLASEDRLRPVP
jgi:glycosyltransferase involved in cell wall biosynthesis